MDDQEFQLAADKTLEALARRLDHVDHDELDFSQGDGTLIIEFEDDGVRYTVNRHRPARQIWLAEPGGGWHFDFKGGEWLCDKRGVSLSRALEDLLRPRCGEVSLG